MNFIEYTEKNRKILEPLNEKMVLLAALGILDSISGQAPDKEFCQDLRDLIEKHKNKIKYSEITALKGSEK